MRLEAVSYRYPRGDPSVLDALDAAALGGDVAVLEGPNDDGKSTLLRPAVGVRRQLRSAATLGRSAATDVG